MSTTDSSLLAAANALAATNPCDPTQSATVSAFQTAWMDTTDPQWGPSGTAFGTSLNIDGRYGPLTMSALDQLLGGSVPQPCVFCADGVHASGYVCPAPPGGGGGGPYPPPAGGCPQGTTWDSTGGTGCVVNPGMPGAPSGGLSTTVKILIALVIVAALGTVGYVVYRQPKKLGGREPRRRMGKRRRKKAAGRRR